VGRLPWLVLRWRGWPGEDLDLGPFPRRIRGKLHGPRRLGRRFLRRVSSAPRHDWKETARECGFRFHTIGGDLYWDESARYEFSLPEIENGIEDPTAEIHAMCMDLVDEVVGSQELMERLSIPERHRDLVAGSWRRGDPHLYGRMDLSYDGRGPAKLLELNYDTPTALYEASFFQWVWLEQMRERGDLPAHADQFNSIQEDLLDEVQVHQGGRVDPVEARAEAHFQIVQGVVQGEPPPLGPGLEASLLPGHVEDLAPPADHDAILELLGAPSERAEELERDH